MEDKNPLLSHDKPLVDNGRGKARGLSCSPDHPITRSPDDPMGRSPDREICSPDHPITRSPDGPISRSSDSRDCRECLGAVAHRLAQAMTALRGGIELGLMGKRSVAEYRALLEQSLQLADSMAQLVVSLRDLGESTAPGGPPQCVLLEAIAAEALAEMEGLAQSRELHLQLEAEGPVKACVNAERLREALLSLLGWVIQNSAGGDVMIVELSAAEGEARVVLSPSRLDLQYLEVKILEDITSPGLLFSQAAKNGALGWAINQRLVSGLGGTLEVLTDNAAAGCIRMRLPLAPAEAA